MKNGGCLYRAVGSEIDGPPYFHLTHCIVTEDEGDACDMPKDLA